jgi:sugar-specific transcriptional regulator TrmB
VEGYIPFRENIFIVELFNYSGDMAWEAEPVDPLTWEEGEAGEPAPYGAIIKQLQSFGLTRNEARVYVFLAKAGMRKANEVAKSLRIHRTETYHLLTALQNKGLVTATFEHPIRFKAAPFREALNNLISLQSQQLQAMKRSAEELCYLWDRVPKPRGLEEGPTEGFQTLQGQNQIHLRAKSMAERAERELCVSFTGLGLAKLSYHGFFDVVKGRSRLELRVLVDSSRLSPELVEEVGREALHIPEVPAPYFPQFVLRDEGEVLFLLAPRYGGYRGDITALWTNYTSFTKTMKLLFDDLWSRSRPPHSSR